MKEYVWYDPEDDILFITQSNGVPILETLCRVFWPNAVYLGPL